MSIQKVIPSGSTNGKPVKVAASSTPGTTFHTAAAGTVSMDEVTMFLSNTDTIDHQATIEFGGTVNPDNLLKVKVPAGESVIAVGGVPLNNGLVVGVFADAANVLTMSGYVNRIS